MFYQSDSMFTSAVVKCNRVPDTSLSVTIINNQIATIKPFIGQWVNNKSELIETEGDWDSDEDLVLIESATSEDKLTFYEDNECYSAIRRLAEAIIDTPMQQLVNKGVDEDDPKHGVTDSSLVCNLGSNYVDCIFLNGPSSRGFHNEIKVYNNTNQPGVMALRNFTTDIRKVYEKNSTLGGN